MANNVITVLQEGYCIEEAGGNNFRADCTVTLIQPAESGCILVDTGGPWNKDKILELIKGHGVDLNDIKTVVCTHGHSDHIGNLNLFPNTCKLIVGRDISVGNVYEDFDFGSESVYKLTSSIDVIPTPGHTHADVSVVVRNTDIGTVVVAGDLFEMEADLHDDKLWKSNSENPRLQEKYRKKVMGIADFIIPGHGPMFRVEK